MTAPGGLGLTTRIGGGVTPQGGAIAPYLVLAHRFPGLTAGQQIRAAVDSVAGTGGTIDCRGFPLGAFLLLDVDMCGNLAAYSIKPYTFLWGAHEVRVTTSQGLRSHHHHVLDGTTFVLKDAAGARVLGVRMFNAPYNRVTLTGGVSTVNNSGVVTQVTPADPKWGALEIDTPLLFFGRLPAIGRDNTTLTVAPGAGDVTLTVTSTAAFPAAGHVRIEDELIAYTGKNATQFTGCTRGAHGTTAAAHGLVALERPTIEPAYVDSVAGAAITLGDGVQVDFTSSGLEVYLGVLDVTFDGAGTFDGNFDVTTDDPNNPFAILLQGARLCYVGEGLVFKNWDHGGVSVELGQDVKVRGQYQRIGRFDLTLGSAVWVFGRNKRVDVEIQALTVFTGISIDDRSTTPQITDGEAEDCRAVVTTIRDYLRGVQLVGCRRCYGEVQASGRPRTVPTNAIVLQGGCAQWATNGTPVDNTFVINAGNDGTGGSLQDVNWDAAMVNGSNTLVCRKFNPVVILQDGNQEQGPPGLRGLTYGVNVAVDAGNSEAWNLIVTNGVAFTINNPTNLTRARLVDIYIFNGSGGAMGAVTFGGLYRLAGAFVAPANNAGRRYTFRWDGAFLREISRNAADVA